MIIRMLRELLYQCSKARDAIRGASLHGAAIKMGVHSDLIICNHLVNLYAKCSNFAAAHQVFDKMPERNNVTWSIMISSYNQDGKHSMALEIFSQMQALFLPNEHIYSSVISSIGSLSALYCGKQVHAHSLKTGCNGVSFVTNSLISMYMRCGCFDDALSMFDSALELNSVSYNAMITGFAEKGHVGKGMELFRLMNRNSLQPDKFSFVAAIRMCSSAEDMGTGLGLHCYTIKIGLDSTVFIGNVILTMYSRHSLFGELEKAFQSIEEKDVITCNAYIAACSHCGQLEKSLIVYTEMEDAFGIIPDDYTLAGVLAACAEAASIRCGGQVHAHLLRTRLDVDIGVYNAIIDMYAKCGCMGYATNVFKQMSIRSLVSWNTMIIGLANHGLGKMAIDIFEQMKNVGLKPDSITFIGLLVACNHSGLSEEGLTYYDSMKDKYGILPEIEHLSCLIDLLGRAGRLEEAESYVKMAPFRDDSIIWGSLLSSCRLHGDMMVGERAARRLLELRPSTSSPYVLLSSLYASDRRWNGVAEAWKLLRCSGVKKEPGHSLIEVKGVMEKFIVGDFSHPNIEEITEILICLNMKAKKEHFHLEFSFPSFW